MRAAWYFLLVFTLSTFQLAFFSTPLEEQFDELELIDRFQPKSPEEKKRIMEGLKEIGMGHCLSSKRTSPINIKFDELIMVSFPELKFEGYDAMEIVSLAEKNNFTETIHGFDHCKTIPKISGGPMDGEYHLMEISWDKMNLPFMGLSYHYGHRINGAKHSMEIHFTHTKNGMSVRKAEKIPGNVVNVVVFISTSYSKPGGLPAFINQSTYLNMSSSSKEFTWAPPDFFLPTERQKYFHYNGSLSHPPCTGNVMWIVMAEPTQMGLSVVHALLRASTSKQSLNLLEPAIKSHPKVFFNRPASSISSEHNQATGFPLLLCGIFILVFLAVVGILALLFFKKRNAKKQNLDANYDVGFQNNNFDSVVLITPNE